MTLPYLYIFEVCICIHANLDRCLSDSWFQYQIIYSEWNTLINSLTIFGQRIYKLPQTFKSCVRMKSFRLALKHFISAASVLLCAEVFIESILIYFLYSRISFLFNYPAQTLFVYENEGLKCYSQNEKTK